jgi:hypothetical protein
MRRLAALAATVAMSASLAHAASAADTASQGQTFLSWPGKAGAAPAAAAQTAAPSPEPAGALTLSKQFFAGAHDDMAAAPPPLMPRNVPGTPAVTNTSTINTASNRARQTELMTADSASDGPTGGAETPN